MSRTEADAAAWRQGKRLLEKAIAQRRDFASETTPGGNSLMSAAASSIAVHTYSVGLATPELHIERVQARAQAVTTLVKAIFPIATAPVRR